MDFLFDGIANWLASLIQGIVDQIIRLIPTVTTPPQYWNEGWAQEAHEVIVTLAWTLLTLRVIAECFRLYVLRDAGETIVPPGVLFRRSIIAAVAIPGAAWFVAWIHRFSFWLATAVASVGVDTDPRAILEALMNDAFKGTGTANLAAVIVMAVVLVLLALAFLVLFIQAAIRGVELAIAYIIGPGLAVSAAGADDFLAVGTMAVWFREVCVLALTQVVQTLLMLAILNYALGSIFDITRIFVALAFMWVAIKTPSILRQYAYHTGIGQMATYGAMGIAVRAFAKLPW